MADRVRRRNRRATTSTGCGFLLLVDALAQRRQRGSAIEGSQTTERGHREDICCWACCSVASRRSQSVAPRAELYAHHAAYVPGCRPAPWAARYPGATHLQGLADQDAADVAQDIVHCRDRAHTHGIPLSGGLTSGLAGGSAPHPGGARGVLPLQPPLDPGHGLVVVGDDKLQPKLASKQGSETLPMNFVGVFDKSLLQWRSARPASSSNSAKVRHSSQRRRFRAAISCW